jgi:hypothetical protein
MIRRFNSVRIIVIETKNSTLGLRRIFRINVRAEQHIYVNGSRNVGDTIQSLFIESSSRCCYRLAIMIVTRIPTPPASTSSLIEAQLRAQSANTLEFVTISNPNEAKNKRIQQRVRRQAGRAGQRSTATPKRRKPVSQTYELTVSALVGLETSVNSSKDVSEEVAQSLEAQRQEARYAEAVGPSMPLGVGFGLNPFQKYPMKMTQKHAMLTDFSKCFFHRASF